MLERHASSFASQKITSIRHSSRRSVSKRRVALQFSISLASRAEDDWRENIFEDGINKTSSLSLERYENKVYRKSGMP